MSFLKKLLGRAAAEEKAGSGDTETVRRITRELDTLEPARARYVAAFAYILSRVANADLRISDDETRRMERIVQDFGRLPEEQAVLAVQIAKAQNRLFGGTEDFLVTREFREVATREQCVELLDCLFSVSAADDAISGPEEAQIRQISSELGLSHGEYVQARSAWSAKRDVLRGLPGQAS